MASFYEGRVICQAYKLQNRLFEASDFYFHNQYLPVIFRNRFRGHHPKNRTVIYKILLTIHEGCLQQHEVSLLRIHRPHQQLAAHPHLRRNLKATPA